MTNRRNNWLPEIFNDFFTPYRMPTNRATAPLMNVLEGEGFYRVELAAAGLTKDDFDVNINQDGDLTIIMEKTQEATKEQAHYLKREFAYPKYEQVLILPDDVDTDNISAHVAAGILTIELPKMNVQENVLQRNIEIK